MQLAKQRSMRCCYVVFYSCFSALAFASDNTTVLGVVGTPQFGAIFLTFSLMFFTVRMVTHIYLLRIAFKMQQVLRRNGLS